MLKKINPVEIPSWQELTDHYSIMKHRQMKDMFRKDPERFKKFSLRFGDILVDYSKNTIDSQTMGLLLKLAEETDVARQTGSRADSDPERRTPASNSRYEQPSAFRARPKPLLRRPARTSSKRCSSRPRHGTCF